MLHILKDLKKKNIISIIFKFIGLLSRNLKAF